MTGSELSLPQVYLRPGELFLAHEPTIIRTILGSCVGVTFWSAKLGIGALCHAMLPRFPKTIPDQTNLTLGRHYVDFCIRDLSQQFDELGAARHHTEVKLFGGADVLFVDETSTRTTVGKLNCDVAIETLHQEGYEVAAASLGDTFGRNIRFNTGNGDVLLVKLS